MSESPPLPIGDSEETPLEDSEALPMEVRVEIYMRKYRRGWELSDLLHLALPSWKEAIKDPNHSEPESDNIASLHLMGLRAESGIKFPRLPPSATDRYGEVPLFCPLDRLRAEAYKSLDDDDMMQYLWEEDWAMALYVTGISTNRAEHLCLAGYTWPFDNEHIGEHAWQLCQAVDLPVQVRRDEQETECPICYDEYGPVQKFYLPCGHSLCVGCARAWVLRPRDGRRCALCKYRFYEPKKVWDVTDEDADAVPMSMVEMEFFDGSSMIFEQPVGPQFAEDWASISRASTEQVALDAL